MLSDVDTFRNKQERETEKATVIEMPEQTQKWTMYHRNGERQLLIFHKEKGWTRSSLRWDGEGVE